MSRACKCDRCGNLYEARMYVPDVSITRYNHPYGEEKLELCDKCQNALELWLNLNRKDNSL